MPTTLGQYRNLSGNRELPQQGEQPQDRIYWLELGHMSIPKPMPVTRRVEYSDWSDLVTYSSLNQSEWGERCGMLFLPGSESRVHPWSWELSLPNLNQKHWICNAFQGEHSWYFRRDISLSGRALSHTGECVSFLNHPPTLINAGSTPFPRHFDKQKVLRNLLISFGRQCCS